MSGYFNQSESDDDFENEERQGNSGSGLRKQLEEALSELRELRKEREGNRQASATDLLKDKGIDPEVIQLVPEGADPVEWVNKYSHLLGAKGTETETTAIDQPEVHMASDDDPALVAEREALEQMNGAQESGSQATVNSDLLEQMEKITDEGELLGFLKENGMS